MTSYGQLRKLSMKLNFKSQIEFGEDFYACGMGMINKLAYLGQAILDLSKIIMYDLHYNYMQPIYRDNLKLCYMDTGKFIYHIHTEDWYMDVGPDVESRSDTSNYNPSDNRLLPIK